MARIEGAKIWAFEPSAITYVQLVSNIDAMHPPTSASGALTGCPATSNQAPRSSGEYPPVIRNSNVAAHAPFALGKNAEN
jgi:hypothetical protein